MADEADLRSIASLIAGVDVASLSDEELFTLVIESQRLLTAAHSFSKAARKELEQRSVVRPDA